MLVVRHTHTHTHRHPHKLTLTHTGRVDVAGRRDAWGAVGGESAVPACVHHHLLVLRVHRRSTAAHWPRHGNNTPKTMGGCPHVAVFFLIDVMCVCACVWVCTHTYVHVYNIYTYVMCVYIMYIYICNVYIMYVLYIYIPGSIIMSCTHAGIVVISAKWWSRPRDTALPRRMKTSWVTWMKRWHRAARRLHAHSNARTHTHNANAREEVYSLLRCAERMTKYTHTHTGGTARRVRGFVREQACLNGRRRCVYTHSVCGFTQRTYVNMCICMYYICSMYTQTMFVLFTLKSKLCSDLI